MYRNVASQKIWLFVFDTATNLGKTGDAANIVPYYSKDGGAITALATATVTEGDATNAKGWYYIQPSATETDANEALFAGRSATAGISVVGRTIQTVPVNASLQVIDGSGRVDVSKVSGTAQTAADIGALVTTIKGVVAPSSSTVNDAAATTTSFVTALTSAVTDFYVGLEVGFTSGANVGTDTRTVSAYNAGTKAITLLNPLAAAPANGDAFVLATTGVPKSLLLWLQNGIGSDNRALSSVGTGVGQLDLTSGVLKANLVQILGTLLTETAGQIAAGFKKLFNVTTPVMDLTNVNQTGDSFARLGVNGASLTALGDARIANLDAAVSSRSTFAGGAVASVTGAVGSVTGTVTVGTNNDKTGYALTSGEHTNIQTDAATGVLSTPANKLTTDASGRVTLIPAQAATTHNATAQAGAASSITLAAGASSVDGFYTGQCLYLYSGTGVGQARTISVYVGASKVATVDRTWATNPDNTSVYTILAESNALLDSALRGTLTPAEHTTIQTDVTSGLTTQGYTTARAAFLDTLNGLVAAIWASATRTLTAFGFTVTAGTVSDKTGYALTAAEHTGMATDAQAAMTAQGYTTARAPKIDNLDATVSSRSTFAGGAVASVTAGVTVTTNSDKTGYALTVGEHTAIQTDAATGVFATIVENGKSFTQMVRIMFSALSGKSSGNGTVFRDDADTKARITATVDGTGNRTAVTKDGT